MVGFCGSSFDLRIGERVDQTNFDVCQLPFDRANARAWDTAYQHRVVSNCWLAWPAISGGIPHP